ncbi:MAG: OmpA family protein [Bacteroidota bacterium]
MKFRFLVLFLLAAGTLYAQRPTKKSGKKKQKSALKTAKEHLRYEEFQEAMPYVQELLETDPNSAYYNYWMGKCLYITYKKNQALPYFEKVEKLNPDIDREFHYWYGLTLHYNLYFERAVTEYRRDLERYEPGSAEYVWVNNRISQCLYAKKIARKGSVEQVKIENMGERINSGFSEHSPVISANDSVLLYTARRPECIGAKPEEHFYDEDVYVAYKKDGEWSEGVNIGRPVNGTGHDATISLTADGKKLYIYRHKKAGGLYVTEFDQSGEKWKEPRPIIKPLNSKYYEASICQSADSSAMFFTSDRPGGYGGRDIYIVRREGKNKWSEPENLGPRINTPFDEDAPYFHPDGKTLYFSSNGPSSIGGFDIFVTEMDSLEETGWRDPLNMGTPVNTPDDDIYFVLSADGKSGYYSSGMEGGYGEKDIYHIKFPYYPYPRRYHVVELAGMVQDVNTLDTLPAVVRLVDNSTNEILDSVFTNSDMGKYYFMLEPERTYALEVSSDGYPVASAELNTPRLMDEDVFMEKNLFLEKPIPSEEPEIFPEIQNIYYDFDQDEIRDDAARELNMVAEFLNQNPDLDLQILSHTDWFGTYDYNVDLSLRRANAAMNYLVSNQRIDAKRVEVDFFSENRPLETNSDDNGRQFNRRSEFRFVRNGEVVFTSVQLRAGVEQIRVDHTTPKGEPGYDNPDGLYVTGDGPETNSDNTVPAENPVGKDAVKNRSEITDGEAAITNRTDIAEADLVVELEELDLHHVYFDFDKYNLRDESMAELDKLLAILDKFSDLQVEVYGHTDAFGTVDYNQRLSNNRAKSALVYLLDNGIDEDQIMPTGYSELEPIDSNDNARGRQNNRRVEFKLFQNGNLLLKSEM